VVSSEGKPKPIEDKDVVTRARNSAYRLLTCRARSRAEIVDKLREKGFKDDVVGRVLADLERYGYINDRRFAEQWAASRVRGRGLGPRRIEQELKQKGISREMIREVLSETFPSEDEDAAAKKAAERKLRSMRNLEPAVRKRRLAGFLERKGFSPEIIRSLIRLMPLNELSRVPEIGRSE
jgi:regulatory protein